MKPKIEERDYEIDITNDKVYADKIFVCDYDVIFNCAKKVGKEFSKNESYVVDYKFLKKLVTNQYMKKIAQIILAQNGEIRKN